MKTNIRPNQLNSPQRKIIVKQPPSNNASPTTTPISSPFTSFSPQTTPTTPKSKYGYMRPTESSSLHRTDSIRHSKRTSDSSKNNQSPNLDNETSVKDNHATRDNHVPRYSHTSRDSRDKQSLKRDNNYPMRDECVPIRDNHINIKGNHTTFLDKSKPSKGNYIPIRNNISSTRDNIIPPRNSYTLTSDIRDNYTPGKDHVSTVNNYTSTNNNFPLRVEHQSRDTATKLNHTHSKVNNTHTFNTVTNNNNNDNNNNNNDDDDGDNNVIITLTEKKLNISHRTTHSSKHRQYVNENNIPIEDNKTCRKQNTKNSRHTYSSKYARSSNTRCSSPIISRHPCSKNTQLLIATTNTDLPEIPNCSPISSPSLEHRVTSLTSHSHSSNSSHNSTTNCDSSPGSISSGRPTCQFSLPHQLSRNCSITSDPVPASIAPNIGNSDHIDTPSQCKMMDPCTLSTSTKGERYPEFTCETPMSTASAYYNASTNSRTVKLPIENSNLTNYTSHMEPISLELNNISHREDGKKSLLYESYTERPSEAVLSASPTWHFRLGRISPILTKRAFISSVQTPSVSNLTTPITTPLSTNLATSLTTHLKASISSHGMNNESTSPRHSPKLSPSHASNTIQSPVPYRPLNSPSNRRVPPVIDEEDDLPDTLAVKHSHQVKYDTSSSGVIPSTAVETTSDLERMKCAARRMHLKTTRPSYVAWKRRFSSHGDAFDRTPYMG